MNEQEPSVFTERVHQLDFAAALRHEPEREFVRRAGVPLLAPWRLFLVWMAIAGVLFGTGMFMGRLAWHP